jgi:serine/threonine protein kinase
MTLLNNRYKIKKELGKGGMSTVYLVSDERLQEREWAIKEMGRNGGTVQDERIISQFRQESEILAGLNHKSLPKIIDYFSSDNRYYLVMDYIEGELLEHYIEKTDGFIEEKEIRKIAIEICDVLEYLHSQKQPVIFRDIKPSNIIITHDGKMKLIDFGIARVFAPGKEKDTIIIGTPGFAAPEQYGTGQTDVRSDIYSFGATLYNMATKIDPSLSPMSFSIPSSINTNLSPAIDTVILKALNLDPEQRFQTVKEMREALEGKATLLLPVCTTPSISSLALQIDRQNIVFNLKERNTIVSENIYLRNKGNRPMKAALSTNQPWLKVDPDQYEGNEFPIAVIVDLKNAPKAKNYRGKITITTQEQSVPLQVYVNVEPTVFEKTVPNRFISYFMLVQSFIPIIGILTLIITFSMCDKEERYKQRLPFGLSILLSVINIWFFMWSQRL